MKIVFFGTSVFAAKILSFLLEKKLTIVAIVTQPDLCKGGSCLFSPVKDLAKKVLPYSPIYQPEKASSEDFLEELRSLKADIFVVAAYGQILKEALLQIPPKGAVNVHASLLPHYRGAAPMQRALMAGEKESGITIMKMTKELDAGDILAKAPFPLDESITFEELQNALAGLSGPLLYEVILSVEKGKEKAEAQEPSLATYAKKILPEEREISWARSAEEIHNLIRALSKEPGAWCWLMVKGEKKRLKVLLSRVVQGKGAPGELLSTQERWIVACGKEALELLQVQLEGKKPMSSIEFLRGIPRKDSLEIFVSKSS